jgi:hypothetical protein
MLGTLLHILSTVLSRLQKGSAPFICIAVSSEWLTPLIRASAHRVQYTEPV